MKLTISLVENLQRLIRYESIPFSSLPKSLSDDLLKEGLLTIEYHRSHRSLRTGNAETLVMALPRYNEALADLEKAALLLTTGSSRAEQAVISGNSKTLNQRSCPGFLVNAYSPNNGTLNNQPFTIHPIEGCAIYIADWESFTPETDTLIIGVENMENFLKIRHQEQLFSDVLKPDETKILFVARYAFSSDLAHWLSRIPNRYLHFGDFDLAGIAIFLSQFKPYVGDRGSFLIPSDIELRLSNGSRKRYDDQYNRYSALSTDDSTLIGLIQLIHKYRRCYDQEGYIQID